MNQELLKQLTSRDTLIAFGGCVLMLGIVLRGIARSIRRELALRKQHVLQLRKSGELERAVAVELETNHWEKYLPRYAAGFIITGLIVILAAYFG